MDMYDALVQDIFKRFPSVQKAGFADGAYKPGLEAMKAFDRALGCPSRAFRSIHVAGTNGKGSVANMLASALGAAGGGPGSGAGLRVGLYTSPHLVDFRERMRINGEMVPREYVEAFLLEWRPYFEEHGLSFFEITTGLAFKWFADSHVDIAVIEVGLGGRLDSTNILVPELSIVTSIGLDHCALLGNTRAEIAREKAGIFKEGVPALVGEWDPETAPVFDAMASGKCPLWYADRMVPSLWDRHGEILADMDLRAPVQEKNLRTVLAALDLVQGVCPGDARNAEVPDLVQGIIHTARRMHFHGRWERLCKAPEVIADIGHNAHALKENFRALEAMRAPAGEPSRPLTIVYGIMADKDLDAIIPLMPEEARYIFVAPETPRALPAEEIRLKAGFGETAPSVKAGVQRALQNATPDTIIYIGGSAFVVAEALPLFLQGTELES